MLMRKVESFIDAAPYPIFMLGEEFCKASVLYNGDTILYFSVGVKWIFGNLTRKVSSHLNFGFVQKKDLQTGNL
jgi:hypothetical protein